MKKIYFLFIALALVLISFNVKAQQWVKVWSDEFDYQGLPDNIKWGYEEGCSIRNGELQNYTSSRLENARVENGNLIIEARKETMGNCNYTSASVISKYKGDWLYGKVEVRAKLPKGRGMWPAIWMLPSEDKYGTWPKSGEIDIMESVGHDPNRVFFTVHTEAYNHMLKTDVSANTALNDPYTNFYTYTLEWFPDSLRMLVDGQKYFTFKKQSDDYKVWPFNERFYLIMNIAVGGSWGGQQGVDDAIFPQQMVIDYVRVYEQQTHPGPYTLTTSASLNGSVQVTPTQNAYPNGTEVTLSAFPMAGYKFVKWGGSYSGAENPLTITMQKDHAIKAYFIHKAEVLTNGIFQNGINDWYFQANSGAVATGQIVNDEYKINISNGGTEPWYVQLQHIKVPLVQGKKYRLNFTATADKNFVFNTGVALNSSPWTSYYYTSASLGAESKKFSYEFTHTASSDPAARLYFDIGKNTGNITFSNISLLNLDNITNTLFEEEVKLSIFPNPFKDQLVINTQKPMTKVIVINANGMEKTYDGIETTEFYINSPALTPGIYVVKLFFKDGFVVKKIIKE